jgi:uncharacterized beta-barrel protein YwiB (DUF1934 family)
MAIIKNIQVRCVSVIEKVDGAGICTDSHRTETQAEGFLKYTDGEIALSYTELQEGEKIFSDVILRGGAVSVIKRGGVECDFEFSEGAHHSSVYRIPPYAFDAEIDCLRIRSTLTREGGELQLIYNMQIGGDAQRVRIRITAEVVR